VLGTLEGEIYNNGITTWGLAALLTAAVLVTALVAKVLLLRSLAKLPLGEQNDWRTLSRELAEKTSTLFIVIAAVYVGTLPLKLSAAVHHLVFSAFVVALFVQLALWADRIVSAAIAWRLGPNKTKMAMRNALSLIEFIVRVGVWSLAFLLIFENLGFDVTALVAGLGIGGIAVALAAQSVLGDLFSSLAIVLDRPFEVGDFIIFGDNQGTVEKIGIKTTRLRSLSGEQIVCANSDLINSRIHNYKRMSERRVLFALGVTYGTPVEKLERIPALLKEIIESQRLTRFDRAHFMQFGDSALNFEIVYFVLSADYNTYMDVHQAVILEIARAFQRERIEFAYPTRTLFVPGLKEAMGAAAAFEDPRLRSATGQTTRGA
jgi:small-conductance mechanosensitive channel